MILRFLDTFFFSFFLAVFLIGSLAAVSSPFSSLKSKAWTGFRKSSVFWRGFSDFSRFLVGFWIGFSSEGVVFFTTIF